MTQEEKQLLLKDLCARIPYHTLVCLNPGAYNKPEKCLLTGVHGEKVHLNVDSDPFRIDHIKPYLRPMSSMTEEEEVILYGKILLEPAYRDDDDACFNDDEIVSYVDYCYSKHLDIHGLIPKGLALEATERMYKQD